MKLAFLHENAVEDYLDPIACAEAAAGALADNFMRVLAPGVAIGTQRIDGHEALDKEIGELDKEAEFGGVEDEGGELVADAVLHEANFLPFDQLALSFGGAALVVAGFLGNLGEFGFGDGGDGSEFIPPALGASNRSAPRVGHPNFRPGPSFGCDHGEPRRNAVTVRWPETPARRSVLAMRCTMRSG